MLKFAANLTLLFNEVPFLDRFEKAAEAGFGAVEFQSPYAFDVEEIAARLHRYDLKAVLHNLPAGNWGAGERGIACLPSRVHEFRDSIGRAIAYAQMLGVPQLNCLAGIRPPDVDPAASRRVLCENLRFAAETLRHENIRLLIEPINSYDIPGFALNRSREALELIDAVGSDNLYLQYDIYHMQRMEGELAATIRANLPRIAHMQLADNPGRHEPGTGEINFPFLFDLIDTLGYDGYIGCEYKPATTTEEGLGWLRQALKRAHEQP